MVGRWTLRTAACARLTKSVFRVIRAHEKEAARYAERTVGKAALHNEDLGFMGASELEMKAIDTGKSIDEIMAEEHK